MDPHWIKRWPGEGHALVSEIEILAVTHPVYGEETGLQLLGWEYLARYVDTEPGTEPERFRSELAAMTHATRAWNQSRDAAFETAYRDTVPDTKRSRITQSQK